METKELADNLIKLCREGKNLEAIKEFYHDKVTSREPKGVNPEFTEGKENVINKVTYWYTMVEKKEAVISDPIVTGNFFSCKMDLDITFKQAGRRIQNEICVYEVKDGKIIAEQFFYEPAT